MRTILDIPFRETSHRYDPATGKHFTEEIKNSYGEYPRIYFHINDRKPKEGLTVYVHSLKMFRGYRCIKDTTTAYYKDGYWFYDTMKKTTWWRKRWKKTKHPWFTHWVWDARR